MLARCEIEGRLRLAEQLHSLMQLAETPKAVSSLIVGVTWSMRAYVVPRLAIYDAYGILVAR